jgi:hypothetical protein
VDFKLVSAKKMESQESCWFWRKKIQRRLSEASEYQDLHTRLSFIASLGPSSLSIWIRISEGIWSNAPKDEDEDEDDDDESTRRRFDESELAHDLFNTDPHTFLSNSIAVVFYGLERKRYGAAQVIRCFPFTFAIESKQASWTLIFSGLRDYMTICWRSGV